MDILQILFLGLVQAITEWLPLSSKTMDTLVYTRIFNGSMETAVPVLLFLHIGTLCAAIDVVKRSQNPDTKMRIPTIFAIMNRLRL